MSILIDRNSTFIIQGITRLMEYVDRTVSMHEAAERAFAKAGN